MNRKNLRYLHRVTGLAGMLTVSAFLLSTVYAEIAGDVHLILLTKRYIVFALPFMVLVMPGAAWSGQTLAAGRANAMIIRKRKRMKFIAMNGLLLTALAILLYQKASMNQFDTTFWILQALEFFFGAVNLTLVGHMIRDGLSMSRRPVSA